MKKHMWLLMPPSGILMGLCLAFPAIGFLEWVAMIPALLFFFVVARDRTVGYRRLYLYGFCYYFFFYLTSLHWFLNLYPMEFLGVSRGEAVVLVGICWVGLTLLQTVFAALVLPLFGLLCRSTVMARLAALVPLLFAAQYVIAEWSQTLTWLGVPWARLAIGQIEYAAVTGSAALFGSYFITFAIVLVNGYLAWAILHRKSVPQLRFSAGVAAAVLGLQFAFGMVGYFTADPTQGTPLVVAAVQGNVGSDLKWSFSSREKSYEVYNTYTAEAAAAGAAFVVFPETFIPDELTEETPLGKYVISLATRYQITIFCGAFHTDEAGNEYNGVFAIYPDGTIDETVYAKRHLVPFGEYVPWRPLIERVLPMLTDMGMLSYDLAPGTDSALFDTVYGRVGTLVCFDSIYEELTRESVGDGAQLLILPTNDSWFTDSRGIYMHHAQARLRAIEGGRWIVRAADTGISSVIAPNGSSYEEQPPMQEGMALSTVYVRDHVTLYMRIGNLLVWLLIAAVLAVPVSEAVFWYQGRRKRSIF
ncbi:MAG: apolipoprotein N-acyltransferase [Clostridia bacterium]|nr:apolipoprotein N-acyltransferase [Clostridia bacterium]